MQAMRYPPKAYKKDFESIEVRTSLKLSLILPACNYLVSTVNNCLPLAIFAVCPVLIVVFLHRIERKESNKILS